MLLETLDIKKDDIVIYSQNIFDLDNNFKIIFKDDPEKKVRKIGFYDVCHFVNEYSPKNLIVYRLMTNINDFSLHASKFGFKMFIKEEPEIIYFDPVFAIRELEEYPGTVDESLRFRIQQIGLTTLSRVENIANFAEIYSIDLRPYEAKFQKDKVFADAIFALDSHYNSSAKSLRKEEVVIKPIAAGTEKPESKAKVKNDKSVNKHDISEDKDFDYNQILKMQFKEEENKADHAKEFPQMIKHEVERKRAFSEFLKTSVGQTIEKKTEERGHFTDIFKSPEPLIKLVEERKKEKVVLRLK